VGANFPSFGEQELRSAAEVFQSWLHASLAS
jgi:hypothetical protein